jgi:hypothetical protein
MTLRAPDESQVVRAGISLEKIFECFPHNALAGRARDPLERGKLIEILLNEQLTHALIDFFGAAFPDERVLPAQVLLIISY